jgi:hypothetical protein
MRRVCTVAVLSITCVCVARAQTIQLPSIHQFSVDTTVVVPDSGHATIAGDNRGATGGSRFSGIGPQRAFGAQRQVAGAGVVARIHDPQEADEALLGGPGPQRVKAQASSAPRFDLKLGGNDPGLRSVAQIKRQRAERSAAERREVLTLVEQARQARSAGKTSTAALFYRTASRQASGSLKKSIDAEWRQLNRPTAASDESVAPRNLTADQRPARQNAGAEGASAK